MPALAFQRRLGFSETETSPFKGDIDACKWGGPQNHCFRSLRPYHSRIEIMIRQARPEDADTIAQFNSSMARETEERKLDSGRVLAGVKALLNDPAKGIYLIAEAQ